MLPLSSQEFGFGFGDDAETGGSAGGSLGGALSVSISGEVSAELLGYYHDFSDGAENVNLGDIFSGKLNFSAGIPAADAVINLKLAPTETPVTIDEAYIRAYFGSFEVEGGLRKLAWGKADSFGPLDIINPLDYSELTDLSDLANFKIARPLVHLSYRITGFSKIEGVFVPAFEPLRFAGEGRWVPSEAEGMRSLLAMDSDFSVKDPVIEKDIEKLDYAQGGVRFTTTIGSAEIGAQYYYGRLTRPAVKYKWGSYDIGSLLPFPIPGMPASVPVPSGVEFVYNPYHQIGIDWAQVLFGFNIRAEFAANITEDLAGDDPAIYNPHLSWSLGFDRDLVWGINLNIQCNETIRLMHDKISKDTPVDKILAEIPGQFHSFIPAGTFDIPVRPLDIEAGTDMTSTQIIAVLTKSFFRDKLEARIAVFWEIEASDCMLIPSLVWTNNAVSVELSGGFFVGDEGGQFGQYWKNSFVKTVLTYSF
jgi:hypothetical protein